MVVDSSGYYYLAGETLSFANDSNNLFLVKMNESFTQNVTWGGIGSEEFSGMVLDSKDNIYIAGSTLSYGMGEKNVALLKYNSSFKLEWQRIWDHNSSDICSGVVVDSLDNIYITGMTNYPYYDVFLMKYNSSGDLQWNQTWSTDIFNVTEKLLSIAISSSDNIFLGINTNITGSEWILLKYDSSGSLLLNVSHNKYLSFEYLKLDSLDNLYAAGSYKDMNLAKFDNKGNLEWNFTCIQNIVPGTEVLTVDPTDKLFVGGVELINTSAIIFGYNMTDYDTYLMKFDNSGILKWNHTILGVDNVFPEIITFDSLGYIYVGGSSQSIGSEDLDIFIYKVSPSGNKYSSRRNGGAGNSYCKGLYVKSPRNFIVSESGPREGSWDYQVFLISYIEPTNNAQFTKSIASLLFFFGLCIISMLGLIYLKIKRKYIIRNT